MPAAEHRKVAASARRAGIRPGTERFNAYVYGTLQKIEKRRRAKKRRGRGSQLARPRGRS